MFYNKVHSDFSSYKVLSTVLRGWMTWSLPYLVVVVIVKENSVLCRSESLYIIRCFHSLLKTAELFLSCFYIVYNKY